MWYFSWILGLGLAAAFGVLNAMWFELRLSDDGDWLVTLDALGVIGVWRVAKGEREHEWKAQVQATIRAHTVAYWVEKFSAEGVPVAPVQIPEELSEDEHVKALGVMVDMEHPVTGPQSVVGPITRMSLTPTRAQGPSPALGQHSAETLAKGGLSDAEIAKLRDAGVILQRD